MQAISWSIAMATTSSPKSEFDAFVQKQKTTAEAEAAIDWAGERDYWLGRLNELHQMIESALKEYIDAGAISVSRTNIQLNEENIGPYLAPQLTIKIGPKTINLVPVGTLLIGTKGRVDVIGPAGRARFMLVHKDATRPTVKVVVGINGQPGASTTSEPATPITWAWKIVTAPPRVSYVDLTAESLYNALIEVTNG
jgi:hypothetical protein